MLKLHSENDAHELLQKTFCAACLRSLLNPCQPSDEKEDWLPVPEIVAPFDIAKPIVGLSDDALLTKVIACAIGRWIARLGLSRTEVRGYVMYRIEQGLANGITYAWADETPIAITAQLIEETFDGRPEADPPADMPDWREEPGSYDRAISDLVARAVAGKIKTKADRRWLSRFRLIQLARATPIFDMPDDD